MSYIKREDVVSKKVITPDGNFFGTVRDMAFSLNGEIGLVVDGKDQSERTVPIKQISAFGDFILLSETPSLQPPTQPPKVMPKPNLNAGPRHCPSCGNMVGESANFCGMCGQKLA